MGVIGRRATGRTTYFAAGATHDRDDAAIHIFVGGPRGFRRKLHRRRFPKLYDDLKDLMETT